MGELASALLPPGTRASELKLLNLTKKVDDLMQITKLATIFDIYSDEKEAVASFKN